MKMGPVMVNKENGIRRVFLKLQGHRGVVPAMAS